MTIRPVIVVGAPMMFVGEAPGAEEERSGLPFVGRSGQEFNLMLADAGILRNSVSVTNVFLDRPPDNNLSAWAITRKEAKPAKTARLPALRSRLPAPRPGSRRRGKSSANGAGTVDPGEPLSTPLPAPEPAPAPLPAQIRGPSSGSLIAVKSGVVDPARSAPALERLASEIRQANPNIIVALGNIAQQALCGLNGIQALRGTLQFEKLTGLGKKVIPTFHPAAVMRKYEWRPSVIADFIKAKEESAFAEARLFDRLIHVAPTVDDLPHWREAILAAPTVWFDIETKARQITCIGFATSPIEVFVLPFWSEEGDYWATPEEEVLAWKLTWDVLTSSQTKIAQNGIYDIQYLFRYGIPAANFLHDTMLLHHSLYPALPKSLAFLGSIYAAERSWKRWRIRKGDTEELKRES